MEQIGEILLAARDIGTQCHSGLVCFTTGNEPTTFSERMARVPEPETGQLFDADFPAHLRAAIALNPAIHDGAIICNRMSDQPPYRILGWSHRLFPPQLAEHSHPNRGSAFNSALAMSVVAGVDAVYFWSDDGVWRFVDGKAKRIAFAMRVSA